MRLARGGSPEAVRAIRVGRPGMPAYNQTLVSDAELVDLQAYLATIGSTQRSEGGEGEGADHPSAHLDDVRATAVIQAAADQIGLQPRATPNGSGTGRGVAFARYENSEAYVATIADVSVDSGTGKITLNHIVVAHDCGLIINPDGLKNQIEGNVIQSASRAILEQVTFDTSRITSVDWRSYPILRFQDVPAIDIVLIDHPDQPAWGAGEITTLTTPPAIANAVFDATGARHQSWNRSVSSQPRQTGATRRSSARSGSHPASAPPRRASGTWSGVSSQYE